MTVKPPRCGYHTLVGVKCECHLAFSGWWLEDTRRRMNKLAKETKKMAEFTKPKKVALPQPKIGPDGKKQWAELFAGMKDDALLEYAIGSLQNDMMAFKQMAAVEIRKRKFKLVAK